MSLATRRVAGDIFGRDLREGAAGVEVVTPSPFWLKPPLFFVCGCICVATKKISQNLLVRTQPEAVCACVGVHVFQYNCHY